MASKSRAVPQPPRSATRSVAAPVPSPATGRSPWLPGDPTMPGARARPQPPMGPPMAGRSRLPPRGSKGPDACVSSAALHGRPRRRPARDQVYRHRGRPIVFPELPILQFIHGEEAITDIYVVGTWETTNDEVLTRLQTIYAAGDDQAVFPGARPRLPLGTARSRAARCRSTSRAPPSRTVPIPNSGRSTSSPSPRTCRCWRRRRCRRRPSRPRTRSPRTPGR